MPAPADPPGGGTPSSPPFIFAQVSSGGAEGGGPTAPLDDTTRTTSQTRALEHHMGDAVRGSLCPIPAELTLFILKQGWACLFGGLLLIAIVATKLLWQPDWPLHRYDALFLFAIGAQVVFLRTRLETWEEAQVILLFHLTGTAMERFKVSAGSWTYPEPGLFVILNVPLFSGFMYAAVGSYMARAIRIFDMAIAPYPPFWTTALLAAAIYVNFFAHHFLPDIRLGLFAGTVILYARTRVWFRIDQTDRWMPLPMAALLSALALWVAESVGTATGTWLYSGQLPGQTVSFAMLGSWYLLLYVAFVTVTLVSRRALHAQAETRDHRNPRQ